MRLLLAPQNSGVQMTKDIRYQCSLRKGENERSKGDRKNGRRVKVAESEGSSPPPTSKVHLHVE